MRVFLLVEKACKKCRLVVEGEACPNCGAGGELTKSWSGYIFVVDPAGEVGAAIGAKAPGKYALKIK